MLRRIRIAIASVMFVLLTLTALGIVRQAWVAQLQWVPALMSLSIGVLLFLLLLTWLTGQSYCSVICPLGIWQDIIARLSKHIAHRQYKYSRARVGQVLRPVLLVLGIVAVCTQLHYVMAFIDPYSQYVRMVNQLLRPLWLYAKDVLIDNGIFDSYLVREQFMSVSTLAFATAVSLFVILFITSWWWGRAFCHTCCPIGYVTGWIARVSLFRIRIDKSKCAGCGACERVCKASCVQAATGKVDVSRCNVCFNCIDTCTNGAVRFALNPMYQRKQTTSAPKPVAAEPAHAADPSRRQFLTTTAGLLAAVPLAKAQEVLDEGLAPGGQIWRLETGGKWEKQIQVKMGGEVVVERFFAIMPPCTVDINRFQQKCISCHLCVTHCPSHVLKPAVREYGLTGILQPTMSFEQGYCRPDCNVCAEVCPTDAIRLLPIAQKRQDKLGWANFNSKTCITVTDHVECGACARHCPHQAITLVEKNGYKVPKISIRRCTGCGACEYYCPARPKAIYVEGLHS